MALTRKDLIKTKYFEFHEFLKKNGFYNQLSLFPDIDDIDIADLTYYLTVTFIGLKTEQEFKDKLISCAVLNDIEITDEQYDLVVPIFREFIIWMRAL
jgi:hypothetical protein